MKTNRIILICFLIALAVVAYLRLMPPNITGTYFVVHFRLQNDAPEKEVKFGLIDFGSASFKFQKNDTVILHPALGYNFFGDTIFRYKVTRRHLELIHGDTVRSFPISVEGPTIMLTINHKLIKRLDLVKRN